MDYKTNLYKRIITILMIFAIVLCGMKMTQQNDASMEVNYIGDVERENQKNIEEEKNTVIKEDSGDKNPVKEMVNDHIRVLLTTTDFKQNVHDKIALSASEGMKITYSNQGDTVEKIVDTFAIEDLKEWDIQGCIRIESINPEQKITIESLERNYGHPSYYGSLELYVEDEGIAIVNELPLELYLRGVLPSEMPASYNSEALKAQAVCARSYAYKHMEGYNFPEYLAHVDDSTSYQVYNNCEETDTTNQAIIDTECEKVTYDGEVVMTYFFSTSSGYTTDIAAWGENIKDYKYLMGTHVWDGSKEYESELSWYKWKITLTKKEMLEILEYNLKQDLGELESVQIMNYGMGGIALELEIKSSKIQTIISTEYSIRSVLGSDSYMIERHDGSTVKGSSLLPSAFFEMDETKDGYVIQGGGYGHGVGMSQNGANEMAKDGMNYIEILEFFYAGIDIDVQNEEWK